MSAATRDVETIAADLGALGVRSGDIVMVHASLRAIGPVVDGAAGVLRAIRMAVGPAGTLVMNLGAGEATDATAIFDCLVTPADPDVGVLAEVFRTSEGTLVGDHPDARFGAVGPAAPRMVAPVPWDDYYGPGSPLERFVRAGGRVVRLGADIDTVTVLHYAEYLSAVPDKRRVSRRHVVQGPAGPQVRMLSCLDDTDGIIDVPGEDYFASITRDYIASGRARTGLVGSARSELIDAADLVDAAVGWLNAACASAPDADA